MTEFNDDEKRSIRSGVMGAISLVTQADSGFFDMFKESRAAADALSQAPAEMRELLMSGLPTMPKAGSRDEMKAAILGQLSEALQVAGKDPATAEMVRNYVMAATQQVAEAAKGVSSEEQQVLDQVHQILGQQGQPAAVEQAPQV